MTPLEHPLLNLDPRSQWALLAVLVALMMLTRGQHFASLDALPSASWAVFFLAGVLVRPLGSGCRRHRLGRRE